MRRRTLLAGAAALPAAWWAGRGVVARAEEGDRVALPDFRRAGDPDDSAAFHRAAATGRPVHLPAGRGSGPAGRYLIASGPDDPLPPGVAVTGDGMSRTVVARSYARPAPFVFHFNSGSADPARNGLGFRFSDLSIEDEVAERGYSEFSYLVMLNGATDVRFERVAFRGFRGDALHLGSGMRLGDERHNARVAVLDCVFDGVNCNNRNAVSVIDCDGLTIERCRFLNCSRFGDGTLGPQDPFDPRTGVVAPGPIDLEPNDQGFPVIRDVVIRDNLFRGGGGNAVNMLLPPNDRVRTAQRGFLVSGNVIEGRDGGLLLSGYDGPRALRATIPYAVRVERNVVRRCGTPFILNGMLGADLIDNQFVECRSHAEIGNTAWNADVRLRGNRFDRCGLDPAGYALWVRECDRVTLERNEFIDCGLAARRFGVGIGFVAGRITRLRMLDNLFASPGGRMTEAAVAFRDATVDAGSSTIGPQRVTFRAQPLATTLRLPPA